MSNFPTTFPGKDQYDQGFSGDPAGPFQSTTWRKLATAGGRVMGAGKFLPGALLSQHRYLQKGEVDDLDAAFGHLPEVEFQTRLGLVVSARGRDLDDQVDVVWSDWAPSQEPESLRAGRQVRAAARARSAKE